MRPVEHPLLAEGKRLALAQVEEALEDPGNLDRRSALHAVGVVLVAGLPVDLLVDRAVFEYVEHFLDVTLGHDRPQADLVNLFYRHHDQRGLRQQPQAVEARSCSSVGGFNLLDNADPLIRIDHLVSNFKSHQYSAMPPVSVWVREPLIIPHPRNTKIAGILGICRIDGQPSAGAAVLRMKKKFDPSLVHCDSERRSAGRPEDLPEWRNW